MREKLVPLKRATHSGDDCCAPGCREIRPAKSVFDGKSAHRNFDASKEVRVILEISWIRRVNRIWIVRVKCSSFRK